MYSLKRFFIAFLVIAVICGCGKKAEPAQAAPSVPASPKPSVSQAEKPFSDDSQPIAYPKDKLFVAADRLDFKQGDLVLRVPRLELETVVVGEISAEDKEKLLNNQMTEDEKNAFLRNDNSDKLLAEGVMLFNLSPLPSKGNPNVTFSGHRDIYGKEFYYIHTITDGDMIYLDYIDRTYCYKYVETKVVKSDDWSPLYCKDNSSVTLISCDPIGTHLNRMVVTAELVDITEYQADK